MPAGCGKRCWKCYWTETLSRRVDQNAHLFITTTWQRVFSEYASWLNRKYEPQIAALRIDKDSAFLADIAATSNAVPTAEEFVRAFPPARLIRHRVVCTFFEEIYKLAPTEAQKITASEHHRVQQLITDLQRNPNCDRSVLRYCDTLLLSYERNDLAIRSVRLYIQAAIGIAVKAEQMKQPSINKIVLRAYLRQKPGQKASLTRFATFLKLPMGRPQRSSGSRRKHVRGVLKNLSRLAELSVREQVLWNIAALEFYHSMKPHDARTVGTGKMSTIDDDSISIQYKGKLYIIPRHTCS